MDMDITVASPAGNGGGSYTHIYGLKNFEDEFRMAKNQDDIKRVLAKIETIYEQVQLDDELVADNGQGRSWDFWGTGRDSNKRPF